MTLKPIIAINFKAYENAFGKQAERLLKKIDDIAKQYNVETIVALPLTEIYKAKEFKWIKIFSQTSHAVGFGGYTGKIPTKALLHYGVKGVVVNHAEDQKSTKEIDFILKEAYDHNLEVLLCAPSPEFALGMSYYKEVSYLAYEPPELIGTGKAVSQYRGEDIKRIASSIKLHNSLVKFLVGAGINSRKDIDISLQLGADGVFISSMVMKSQNIERTFEEIFGLW